MSWDPALLRKYSSTNHYKLLNQVRSDLKEQPIQRSSGGSSRRSSSAGSGSSSSSSGSGGTRRRSVPAPVPQATPMQSTPANSFDPFVTVPVLIAPFE
ncbi:hypothetical protein [Vulcanococcus sp.]|jgi:hypothetical protein|uniref:hypothetical protein n=1 Tax=Vulcanococcus sp. TaxID=2856995 RepID=UPI0037D9D0D9